MKKALITGITGQDGSYLAELLLEKGYEVHGTIRRSTSESIDNIEHICKDKAVEGRFFLHDGDLIDGSRMQTLVRRIKPDEIYNLAAQSHVKVSFELPEYTGEVNALGVVRILDAVREAGLPTRFYQASTSELYGKVTESPQKETTPFHPRSPYACAKAFAFYIVANYREAYGMHASNGILFNHESPRRGTDFVTRKITRAAARIKLGLQDCLCLGNMEARRDWGFAGDYVRAMWMMLQQPCGDDYVIATGETRSVRQFVEAVFSQIDMPIEWEGSDVNEVGLDRNTGRVIIRINPLYYRPAEVDLLIGDAGKAKNTLGWSAKVSFDEMVRMMIEEDLRIAGRECHGRN